MRIDDFSAEWLYYGWMADLLYVLNNDDKGCIDRKFKEVLDNFLKTLENWNELFEDW